MGENLYIFGEIGWDVDAKTVSERLREIEGDQLTVHIHSRGGNVSEGFAIHEILTQSGKEITTIITGLCASIATIIALAGKERKITQNSEFMIHNPWVSNRGGDADDYEETAKRLRETENKIIEFYHKKTGANKDEIRELMKAETFLTPEKAVEMGFATEVLEPIMAMAYEGNRKTEKQAELMKNIKTMVNDAVNALLPNKKEEVKDEVQAYELALENGNVIVCNNPQDQNQASEGDFVKLRDDAEQIEDGEYIIASTKQMIRTESGKIVEIKAADEVEEMNNLAEVVNGMAEVSRLTAEKFSGVESKFENVENLIKSTESNFEKLEKLIEESMAALREENEALKNELTEVKANISSGYEPPRGHEVLAKAYAESLDKTTEELNKIKNRNK